MSGERILVVDDERLIRWSLTERLRREGFSVLDAEDGAQAKALSNREDFDLLLMDLRLPDCNGIDLMRELRNGGVRAPVIIITAHSTVDNAVEAMRQGAYDYVTKPFNMDALVFSIRRALENVLLRREVSDFHRSSRNRFSLANVVGRSAAMTRILELVRRVAASEATTILLRGESGVGKEVIARAIHYESNRAERPFLAIGCTAIPETLLESELFGHEKGAFTDAKSAKKGLFELAEGGSIFLDEIGDMPLSLQAKLLRVLEDRTFRHIGGTADIRLNSRILAATNRNLEEAMKKGEFRSDLFYRLSVIPLNIPPLRERREDVAALVEHFIAHFNREFRKSVRGVDPAALRLLEEYHWPGNVRELRNVVERAMLLGTDDLLGPDDLPTEISARAAAPSPSRIGVLPAEGVVLDDIERDLVLQALERSRWNQTRAAELLHISRDQIRYRIEKFGLAPAEPDAQRS